MSSIVIVESAMEMTSSAERQKGPKHIDMGLITGLLFLQIKNVVFDCHYQIKSQKMKYLETTIHKFEKNMVGIRP